MSTLRVVYVVCAYICCLHVAADVLGTSQECDDEVCLLQNLVRKPSVLPGESELDETHASFLQLTSHIDDALREAALEAMKDLTDYCQWTPSKNAGSAATTRWFKTAANKIGGALSSACTNGKLTHLLFEKTQTQAKCQAKCAGGKCLAIGAIQEKSDAKKVHSGCWALMGTTLSKFPTFANAQDCFQDAGSAPKDSAGNDYKPGSVSFYVCKPSLANLYKMANAGSGDMAQSKQLLKFKSELKRFSKNGNYDTSKMSLKPITLVNGELVYDLVGMGKSDLDSSKITDVSKVLQTYIEGLINSNQGLDNKMNGNVAKVTIAD